MELPWASGSPVIARIVSQAMKSKRVGRVIVATSADATDDPIADFCRTKGIPCFRGSLTNVHERYCKAAAEFSVSQVVRLTGDNPLVDSVLLDQLIDYHLNKGNDYTRSAGLPLGCNFELVRRDCLEDLVKRNMTDEHREHVTLYLKHFPNEYKTAVFDFDLRRYGPQPRATIDYPSDYAFWNLVLTIDPGVQSVQQLLEVVRLHPWLNSINHDNLQKNFERSRGGGL
jgi:spore coat polysaccharide biosynthesis protein SpsF